MRRSLLLLAVLLAVSSATLRADQIDNLVMRGLDQMYSVQFDEAGRSFDQAIALDRNDPRGYFYRATLHLWSYIFGREGAQLELFLKQCDQTIAVAEKRLDENDDPRARLFLGLTYGYKAIANARAENFTAAALSGRTCYQKLNELTRDNPNTWDAYLGLGIFHFIFGSIPKAGQVIGNLGGIKGDAQLGLKEIAITAQRGTYFKNDAQLIQALLAIYYLNDLDRGVETLSGIARRYPKNVALQYAIGAAYMSNRRPDRAWSAFAVVVREANPDFKLLTDLSTIRCADIRFMKNDFAGARGYYQRYLQSSKEKVFQAHGWQRLGICFEMEGKRDLALKAYARVRTASEITSPEDRYAARKARQYTAAPISSIERTLLRAINAVAAGDWTSAMNEGVKAIGYGNLTPDQNALAYYVIGRGYQGLGKPQRGTDAYRLAAAQKVRAETWVAPFSYFYAAECYSALGDRTHASQFLALAKRPMGYDFEGELRFLIERDVTKID